MKRVRCSKCDTYITFDETRYSGAQRIVFECPECRKHFAIRVKVQEEENPNDRGEQVATIIVVENVFHFKQELPIYMGENVLGRKVKGTDINTPIETVDPSVDTKHCIISAQRNKKGTLQFILRDAPSNTGTFYMNDILKDCDRVQLHDGDIITIGATTLILKVE